MSRVLLASHAEATAKSVYIAGEKKTFEPRTRTTSSIKNAYTAERSFFLVFFEDTIAPIFHREPLPGSLSGCGSE